SFMPKRSRIKLCAVFFLLGTSSTLVLMAIATSLILNHYRFHETRDELSKDRSGGVGQLAKAGPWGRLEVVRLPFANPYGMLPDQAQRFANPRWLFESCAEMRLTRFLDSCDLGLHPKRVLLDKRFWNNSSNGLEVLPTDSAIWSLGSQSRGQIYSVLAKNPANYAQRFPFVLSGEDFGQHLNHNGMTVQNVEKIMRLTYTNSGNLCFTDLHTAKELLPPDQFQILVGVLYEIPAYHLRLIVGPGADVDALVRY